MMLSSHTMEPALSSLSLPDANIWLNVLTDAEYDRAQAGAANTSKIHVSSYRDFAKFVSTTPKSLDPEHSKVVIHRDGTIAAVYFDFVFKIDGKAENRGSETRQLVKAVGGWRIAITYSSDPAPGSNSDQEPNPCPMFDPQPQYHLGVKHDQEY
jgi:hypothetical protein